MKFIATRVCVNPRLLKNKLCLSFDSEIWGESEDLEKIKVFFYDEYGCDIEDEFNEYNQPKAIDSLEHFEESFIPCVLGVKEEDYQDWLNSTGYNPETKVYLKSDLVLLGFEILDLGFISINSHGISVLDKQVDFNKLNKYCLFKSLEHADIFLKENLEQIPEHNWKITGLYTSKKVFKFLSQLNH